MKAVTISGIKLNASDIEQHLRSLGEDFLTNLQKYSDVSVYSQKLSTFSIINALMMDQEIAGLVAYYYNKESFEHCVHNGILEVKGLFLGWIE